MKRSILFVIYFCLGSLLWAQPGQQRFVKIVIGGGYGHFFNSFKNVLDKDVENNKPAFIAKLIWQPEHRLRVGIESGYYFVYSTSRIQTMEGKSQYLSTDMDVLPVLMTFSMRIAERFEINIGSGWASMIYSVHARGSKKDKVVGHLSSMSNYMAGCSYYFPLGTKVDLGAELKYLYFGKTGDHHTAAFATFSYKF